MAVRWLLIMIFIVGCRKLYFSEEPVNSTQANFDVFWNDFNRYYGQFELRHIDWDSVYKVYQPKIKPDLTEPELFDIFNSIIQILEDGHVNLYTPLGIAGYSYLFPSNYSGNRLINSDKYITFLSEQNSALTSGTIDTFNLGYIGIATFYSNEFGKDDPRYNLIDAILEKLKDKKGIIIDVRSNGGGNSSNALTIASRFADKRYLYYKQRFKIGPGRNDFSDWVKYYIAPEGKRQYTKPVIVLTSRYTYSAAEVFVSAMSVFPNVTLVGDTTAGGIGDPIFRELPNGWSYRLSTSIGAMADDHIIDVNGITPEVVVLPLPFDLVNEYSRDVMLEKAIQAIGREIKPEG